MVCGGWRMLIVEGCGWVLGGCVVCRWVVSGWVVGWWVVGGGGWWVVGRSVSGWVRYGW